MKHNGVARGFFELIESELTGGYWAECWAECSCGWKGEGRPTMPDAEKDLLKHYDEVSL